MSVASFRMIRPVLAAAVILAVPAFAVCSLLRGGANPGATVELGADDPIRAGFRVTAPREPAALAVAVAQPGNAVEEVVPLVWVFTSKGNPSPWQGGGAATTTTISGPSTAKHGTAVSFSCSVTGHNTNSPPSLSCTFYDGSTSIGTCNLSVPGSGQTSTGSLSYTFTTTGKHSISCKYTGDYNDMPSTSGTLTCTVS